MKNKLFLITIIYLLIFPVCSYSEEITLSEKELNSIGEKIFRNECGGRKSALVSWNKGEDFPSLGIGHFIWFPENGKKDFEESFIPVLKLLKEHKIKFPEILLKGEKVSEYSPWNSRKEFLKLKNQGKFRTLEVFLYETKDIQMEYLIKRFKESLNKILKASTDEEGEHITRVHKCLLKDAGSYYPLIDYTNFKGEGINPKERYKNQGWGLKQVFLNMDLEEMKKNPLREFVKSVKYVLERRVKNSPPDRKEHRWLKGWMNRIRTYSSN